MPKSAEERSLDAFIFSYQLEDHGASLRFGEAINYFRQECVCVYKGTSEWKWEDESFLYTLWLTLGANTSLRVRHKSSGVELCGNPENLATLKMSIVGAGPPDALHCRPCARTHTRYGMELEFILGSGDEIYKSVFLRKCNDKTSVDVMRDSIGLDGSRTPIEIRNVNGNTAEELFVNLNKKVEKVRETFKWMRKNLPGVESRFSVQKCGVHIHHFHPGVPRSKVVAAFTAVCCIINDFDAESWTGRMAQGYGLPFAARGGVDWCRTDYATELRVLNAVHPDIVKFCIESMEECLKKSDGVANENYFYDFLDKQGRTDITVAQNPRANLTRYINEMMAFFIKKKVIRPIQVNNMIRWLSKNYKPLKEAIITRERL